MITMLMKPSFSIIKPLVRDRIIDLWRNAMGLAVFDQTAFSKTKYIRI